MSWCNARATSGPHGPRLVGVRPVNDISTSATTFERERDRHWFTPGPKRILALDGGGVRGAISVAFLEQIEKVLCERMNRKEIHLGDYFDLIGGTSPGAIVGGPLARGRSVQHIMPPCPELAPRVFRRHLRRIQGLQAKFDAQALREEI